MTVPIDYQRLMAWSIPEVRQTYCLRDAILYALGVGCGNEADPAADFRYVYEEGLAVLPSMATVLGYPGFWLRDPGTGVNWRRAVHAGQTFETFRPLAPQGSVIGRSRVSAITDKGPGRGALLTSAREIFDEETGTLIARLTHTAFLRDEGGFAGPAAAPQAGPIRMPGRDPDQVIDLPTSYQAALLYRLSGDLNPLHADPAVAVAAGFPRPILHGLCTLGIATRAILRRVGGDPALLHRLSARFSAPVLPGETIRTQMWGEGSRILFRALVPGRDALVLDQGVAEIRAPAPSR